ncbi:MAG: RNA polymerase sigma factor [Phycisphaeraceae bacterium]|nr:MAG: RNA polymerase sigma factor [Phycisphaeraceae bacterium]
MTNAGSDLELVRLIRKGDERAARELWARVGPSLLAVARAVTRDAQRAEDVVQQAMCRVLELRERQVREIRDVSVFLACMVRRLAINDVRSNGRHTRHGHDAGIAGVHRADVGRATISERSDERLSEAIASLPDELAEVVLLRHVGGLTFDQLAFSLDQNRSTIAGRYRRAIEELERLLGGTRVIECARDTVRVTP